MPPTDHKDLTHHPLFGYALLFFGPSLIAYIWANVIASQSTYATDHIIPLLKSLFGLR